VYTSSFREFNLKNVIKYATAGSVISVQYFQHTIYNIQNSSSEVQIGKNTGNTGGSLTRMYIWNNVYTTHDNDNTYYRSMVAFPFSIFEISSCRPPMMVWPRLRLILFFISRCYVDTSYFSFFSTIILHSRTGGVWLFKQRTAAGLIIKRPTARPRRRRCDDEYDDDDDGRFG